MPSRCSDIKPSAGHIFERLIIPKLPPQYVTVAVGIVGAVIMPHNLYLHSALVQSRWVLTRPSRPHARLLVRSAVVRHVPRCLCGCAAARMQQLWLEVDPHLCALCCRGLARRHVSRKREAMNYFSIESAVALLVSLFINVSSQASATPTPPFCTCAC